MIINLPKKEDLIPGKFYNDIYIDKKDMFKSQAVRVGFEKLRVVNTDFSYSKFEGCIISSSFFYISTFNNCNLKELNVGSSKLKFCSIKNANISDSHWNNTKFDNIEFNGSNLSYSTYSSNEFTEIKFGNVNLQSAKFNDCKFVNCDFTDLNNFYMVIFNDVEFINCRYTKEFYDYINQKTYIKPKLNSNREL